MATEAELHRRRSDGTLAPWLLASDPERGAGALSDPVIDAGVRARLSDILAELRTDTTLDAATLAALEEVAISNLPPTYPLPDAQVTALTPPANPADYPLPAAQVTALTPPAQPAAYPLPDAQVTALTPPTGSATEATLEAVRAQVAAVNANTDAIEALLDGQNALLGRDFTQAHQNGLNFVGGERLNFGGALATNRYVAAIRNPATNTKIAYVYAVVLYTSVTQWFRWAVNPTLDSPVAVESPRSLNLANPGVASLEMWSDTIAPTVADHWSPETRVTQNGGVPLSFPRPVAVGPGTTFAVIGESSATQETCANVYFYEKAI